ncbi:oligoendopeptidase F [Halalkalibacterium ligniniphilum]|uniref:oligoendopeptidase F n=2 Tax=Halalkalibacterium ligniniphilum TaxID=1134413 RepID=UPI00034C46E8|nr:oligoendopeptidase F [Halalkalibacterium ligniniphilum]
MNSYVSRKDVPEHETWDLTDIYVSSEEWKQDYQRVDALSKELQHFDGKIVDGASLFSFLTKREELNYISKKVFAFARLSADLDTRSPSAQSLVEQASQLSVTVNTATSFFRPFLLSLEETTLKEYLTEVDGLQYFEEYLFEAYRFRPYVLNKDKEEVLSYIGEALSAPSKTFGMLNNADIQFGFVKDKEGNNIRLTRGLYAKRLEDNDRNKRKEAYKAYYQPYVQLNNSIASTLSAAIKNNVMLSNLRGYPSALERSLFADNIPLEVYENLIETTKKHIAPIHRYTAIRKQMLGLDELRQYDLNVPLIDGMNEYISYDDAYDTMLEALRPLGNDYIETLRMFRTARYIDVRETPGKRSGAYNMGLYGVHPFVLLNHRDDLNSMFTLVHEMGHAMHSHYSSNYQPQISASYTIFVAEVASTVNELLLIHYLLAQKTDRKSRKYLLNHFIDKFRGTFFTQVMFAEFEKKTHEMIQNGEPLNAEVFNNLYEKLFCEYQGNILTLDEEVKYGWSRIPHFYRPFYVYKYATGFASAIQIAGNLLKGKQETVEAYLHFLKSGSSDYPLELLNKTGVNLSKPGPIEAALKHFNELVNEFEKH